MNRSNATWTATQTVEKRKKDDHVPIDVFAIGALATNLPHEAFAVPITYTLQATATGSLGRVVFTNASVVIMENAASDDGR